MAQELRSNSAKRKYISKHGIIMLLCCLIPLGLIGILWAAGISGSYLVWGVFLLCPLLHVFMMRGMHGDGKHDHER